MDLFTYGTLQFDEVWRRVVGRDFPSTAAEARGFAAYRVVDADYPGMIPRAGATTPGTLYRGVDDVSLARLDMFEGDQYQRLRIEVVANEGQSIDCQAYVIPASKVDVLTGEPWSRESFLGTGGLERFMGRYRGFWRDVDPDPRGSG